LSPPFAAIVTSFEPVGMLSIVTFFVCSSSTRSTPLIAIDTPEAGCDSRSTRVPVGASAAPGTERGRRERSLRAP